MSTMLDPADLHATCRPFAEARTLPGAAYTSGGVLALEQSGLFARTWLAVGRAADMPQAGDFVTRQIGTDNVLLVRGEDGRIRGFHNVCRHRGARLLDEPAGTGLARILCPYHAWSYRLDGSLGQLPGGGTADRGQLGLVPVATGLHEGFIFVNLDPHAPPLALQLEDLPDLRRFRLPELRAGWRRSYDVQANWKLIVENYSECYHCPGAHPQLARISDLISRSDRPMEAGNSFNGGPMQLKEGIETMSLSGRRTVPVIPGLSADDHRYVYYYVIYPNLLLSPHPDYVLTHTAWPLAPDRTRVECELLFTAEALARPGFDPADMANFWDLTNRQDWALCERTQAGAASRGFRPGPYQPSEDCVHTFDRWYAERLAALLGQP
ncbi:MAG: aromatic ring-hydroxylating dioxygenase subunit alpha [Gammaproteobacteria bacterium]|nr:aromatic ring-hydroxylating dioxygenase subunit alpha [Gammaproteobacteria bacterium]